MNESKDINSITKVPYSVIRAGEYWLNSKAKIVGSISELDDNTIIVILDREHAFTLDKESLFRELKNYTESGGKT